MATRSTIGMLGQSFSPDAPKFDDNRPVTSIYCHNDGYLEHNGALLDIYYREPKTVANLIALGDMSSLGYIVGVKHDYERRQTDTEYYEQVRCMSCFYHRDRDGLNGHYPLEMFKGRLADMPMESWCYVYVPEEQQWYVLENNKWMNLHKRIFMQVPNIEEIVKPLSHSINPTDKEAIAKINAYGKAFKKYRAEHPYIPSYYKLKDENDSREYWMTKGFGPSDINYRVFHIDKIEKDKDGKVVFFTPQAKRLKSSSVRFNYFIEKYFEDAGIVLKNPSSLTPHLPK